MAACPTCGFGRRHTPCLSVRFPPAFVLSRLCSAYGMASSIEELRGRLSGLAQMLDGAGSGPGVALVVSVSPPRSKPAVAGARRNPQAAAPPPPRQTARPISSSSSVLQAANAHARDAPIGGLLAKYKDAEAGWLKVRGRQRGGEPAGGEAKGQVRGSHGLGAILLLPTRTPPCRAAQEKGRLQMAAKAEQQRRIKAEGELRRVQVRGKRRCAPTCWMRPFVTLGHGHQALLQNACEATSPSPNNLLACFTPRTLHYLP